MWLVDEEDDGVQTAVRMLSRVKVNAYYFLLSEAQSQCLVDATSI